MGVSLIRRLLDAPSSWTALDAVATPLRRAVHAVPEPARRALHGTWLGHPTHPIAVQVTIGCYVGAAVLDVLSMRAAPDRRAGMRDASTALMAVGVASTATSVASGLADWAELQKDQERTGLVHAAVNSVGTAVAAGVVANRRGSDHEGTPWGSLAVGGVMGAGAALGGHLAYRWGAGANHADDIPHLAPSDWVDVGAPDEFPERQPVRRQAGDVGVVVVRTNGRVQALAQRCSHLGGPLEDGTVETIDGVDCVVCPWHGSAFTLAGGESAAGPAVYPQPRFEVREAGADGGTRVQVRVVPEVAHQLG